MSDFELEIEESKTVEDYLNETNYSSLEGYQPSDFALGFINFMKLVDGGESKNKTPVVHLKMLDNFVVNNGKDTINMCHRGIAKSTLLEYLIFYIAVFGELPDFGTVPYALYVSDTMDNGVDTMKNALESRYYNSPFLQKYLPKVKFIKDKWDFTNLDGVRFVVSGHGAQTGVRGTRENGGQRPVLALLDDLISDKDANSQAVITAVENTIDKAIEHALDPQKRKIIWNGTPFNARDPLYKAVNSGAYNVNVYPVCEYFPCSREDFKGSWPDRFTYDSILTSYTKAVRKGNVAAFNQELMLRIMSSEERSIQDEDIQWYKLSNVMENKNNFNFYITTDFATAGGAHNDFSVISVWAYNSEGQWFWVDGVCKKQDMSQNIKDLFRLAQKYRTNLLGVGIEVSGQQGGFVNWIQDEMFTKNVYFHISSDNNGNKPGIRPTSRQNKISRFNLIVPWFKSHKIFLPIEKKETESLLEAVNELSLVSPAGFKSKHDDWSDTLSMLMQMNPIKPSPDMMVTQGDDGLWGSDTKNNRGSSGISSYIV